MNTFAPLAAHRLSSGGRAAAALVAALSTTLAAGTTRAADAPPQVVVRFGDLNLDSVAGTQVLLHRLSAAAHRVCGSRDNRELAWITREEACFQQALRNAVVAVHNERLSALYRAQSGSAAT